MNEPKLSLRSWQAEFLEHIQTKLNEGEKSFLLEATPGAGKTTAALTVASHQLNNGTKRVLVVVPTRELRRQWARAAHHKGIELDPTYETGKPLTRDFQGVVVTYQQVANRPAAFRHLAASALVILDEVHHAGDGRAWGVGLREAFSGASFILCLSGTAFRSDQELIPFIRYMDNESDPDYVYSYRRAIEDQVCRPVAFTLYGGEIGWVTESDYKNEAGETYTLRTEEKRVSIEEEYISQVERARSLKMAVDPQSRWLVPMLQDAHALLTRLREQIPAAGGLVVCNGTEEARGVADLLQELTGSPATLVLSNEPNSATRIKQFSQSFTPWIVACNMVSEGVDIPRLRVGVYATTITTKMYFRQFLGRIVRVTGRGEVGYCFLPADPRLVMLAKECEEDAKHQLGVIYPDQPDPLPIDDQAEAEEKPEPTHKLRPLESSADVAMVVAGGQVAPAGVAQLGLFGNHQVIPQARAISLEAAAHEVLQRPQVVETRKKSVSASERKQELGRTIKGLVGRYCAMSGQEFQQVYARLNKMQGVYSQSNCTLDQLEQRLAILKNWLH